MVKKIALTALTYICVMMTPLRAEISIGDISARIDDLEKRIRGENPLGDELATKEDIENLSNMIKMLTGRIEVLEHQLNKTLQEKSTSVASEKFHDPLSKKAIDHLDPEPKVDQEEKVAGEKEDTAEVDAVLESLGASTSEKKATEKAKIEEIREKATQKAEKTASSVLDEGGPAAQFNQAKGLLNKGQYAEAEEAFKHYLATHSSNKEVKAARVHLGEAQLKQKKYEEAKGTFAKAYQSNSKGTEGAKALLGLAESLAAKDKKKACIVLKKLKEDFPTNKEITGQAKELHGQYNCS